MTKIKGSNILITGGGPALVKQWEILLSKKGANLASYFAI
jgi:hypothetical protein